MADTAAAAAAEVKPAEAPKTATEGEEILRLNGSDAKPDRRDRRDDRDRDHRGGRGARGGRGRGGPRGGGGFKNRKARNNEFEDLPETDDPVEIRNQVEFYFSTHNLVTDEHLFKELDGPKNRPVSIKHIADFKRMRRFQPYSAIVAALRESKDLLVVDDGDFSGPGNEAVKRKEPLSVPTKDDDEKNPPSTSDLFFRLQRASSNDLGRSAYVKGFGDPEAGQIALEQFFRPFGAVMVRKRREADGTFKGSVFVEFDTEDSQKQFLALDPAPKFNDNALTIMGKKEYSEMKCKEKGIKPEWERSDERREHRDGRDNRSGGRGARGGRGGRDDRNRRDTRSRRDRSRSVDGDDWKDRRDRFQSGKDDQSKESKPIERDAHGVPVVQDTSNKRKADDDAGGEDKKSKLEIKEDA
ncbi:nucleic acid binding [Ascochyta rabiei]|uniref:Nucleic acid binding n=1 Tax=Didymella rabiei TaxID=5454 RepID=A0A163BBU8_DIDRA|nr:nucleic acid binding [Ascochyta rabiei]